jgi:hypothetical protein
VPRPQLLSHAYRLGGVERKATTTAALSSGRHDGMPTETARYWRHGAVPGVDLLRATYVTHRYARHAHETYTVGVIESGVEEFDYGGARLRAGPGAVALLNPEVVHTGQAGPAEGWSYRMLYPAVSLVAGQHVLVNHLRRSPRCAMCSRTGSPILPASMSSRWLPG